MVLTPIVARLAGKVDTRILATVAFVTFGASFWMRSGYTSTASPWNFIVPLLIQGIGMSTFFLAMLTISLDGIAPERIPSATGLSNFARIVAGSFAASVITTAWDRREALHQSRLAEAVGAGYPFQSTVQGLGRLGFDPTQAAAAITRQLVQQAYLLSSSDLFRVSAWLCFALVMLVWFTKRPMPPTGPVSAD